MLVWIFLLLIAVVIEIMTVQLVSLPFIFGAIFAILAVYLKISVFGQIIIFAVTSIIALIIFQIAVKTKLTPHKTPTNLDALVGKELIVESFENGKGTGSVNGVKWRITSDEELSKDMLVKIKKIDGTTLVVGKV